MRDAIEEIIAKPATSWIASGVTVATGSATAVSAMPTMLGIVASCVGIALSSILIYTNIQKYRLDKKLLLLQIAKHRDT